MTFSKSLKTKSLSLAVLSLALCMMFGAGSAFAQPGKGGFVDPAEKSPPTAASGGFSGPGPDIVTVSQIKQMTDDTKAAVKGSIVQHLGGKDYLFKDATGTITVEISKKDWAGQNVTPQDTVIIYGEVDKDVNGVKLEADQVIKQ